MKGVYVLVLSASKDIIVKIGASGYISFKKGLYAYVGSAQTGLEKRIERHLRKAKRKFWHIDWLLDSGDVKVVKVFHKEAEKSDECTTAERLSLESPPIDRFGCSDCKCQSHPFKIDNCQFLREFMSETIL